MDIFTSLKKDLLKIHASLEDRLSTIREGDQSLLIKQAFDTRRIDQETQFNPRRNLQYYQRSEPFISNEISEHIKSLFKVKTAADTIKEQFIGDPDWLDSRTRILCNALNTTLRIEQQDYDFAKPKFDYLDELLYLRYRLKKEDIERMSEQEIKNVLLAKDERLSMKSVFGKYDEGRIQKTSGVPEIIQTVHTKQVEKSGEDLLNKLFGDVKASKENKNVKRSINITISDSILDKDEEIKE